MVLIQEGDKSEEAIMETFNILRTFFNDKKELSDNELIGLYRGRFIYQYCQIKFCGGSKCLRHMICLTIVT